MTNRAQWHKTCWLKYSKTMLLQKVKQSDAPEVCTQPANSHVNSRKPVCFFLQKASWLWSTPWGINKTDFNVRNVALEIEDAELLAKFAPGDMIVLKAKYHQNFLRMVYNKWRQDVSKGMHEEEAQLHDTAFTELVVFIDEKMWWLCCSVQSSRPGWPVQSLTSIERCHCGASDPDSTTF